MTSALPVLSERPASQVSEHFHSAPLSALARFGFCSQKGALDSPGWQSFCVEVWEQTSHQ
jgi:hypothetical protein